MPFSLSTTEISPLTLGLLTVTNVPTASSPPLRHPSVSAPTLIQPRTDDKGR
jgi:hypothetical protein